MTKRSGHQSLEDKRLDNGQNLNDKGVLLVKEAVEKLDTLRFDEVTLQKELTWLHTWLPEAIVAWVMKKEHTNGKHNHTKSVQNKKNKQSESKGKKNYESKQ